MRGHRHDKTGRSASGKLKKHKPKNSPKACGFEQFGWYPLDLMESEAFRALSPNSLRLLMRLVIEHVHHGGIENGLLVATHDQLRDYGLTASSIRESIDECVAFGLISANLEVIWAMSALSSEGNPDVIGMQNPYRSRPTPAA